MFKDLKSKIAIRKSYFPTIGRVELKCKLSGSSSSETILDFVLTDAAKAIPLLGLKGCLQMNLISKIKVVKSDDLAS